VSEESFLSDDFVRQLIGVGDVDLMVGVLSLNDAKTVVKVSHAVEEGVLRNYRRERVVLVNVDGGSRDGTQRALLEASSLSRSRELGIDSLRTLRWITTTSGNERTTGHMLRTMLAAADLLNARACAIVSASSANASPVWVDSLLKPVYRDSYDFVAPLYTRHKFDGLLTRNLLYPISRALYGKPVRELRARELAFSNRFASYCISEPWPQDAVQGGADMWIAIQAMTHSFRCCQTYLGEKERGGTGASVVASIRQTVGSLFRCMEATDSYWQGAADANALDTLGPDHELSNDAGRIDRSRFLDMFKEGINELSGMLAGILQPETLAELVRLTEAENSEARISNRLWARIVYEFAAAYHHSVMDREHLVQALIPIYRGRVYSFLAQHRLSGPDAVEADLDDLCREFESQKDFLIDHWKSKVEAAS